VRHAKKSNRLGANASHRKSILQNLATDVLKYERLTTTRTRAIAVRPLVEKMVALAKRGDLHARRQASEIVNDKEVVNKLFSEISKRYEDREGGYTRILKIGPRQGDAAFMVIIELV
jgi:large subunit ribosomal protein L17